jgi:hypothetical protein
MFMPATNGELSISSLRTGKGVWSIGEEAEISLPYAMTLSEGEFTVVHPSQSMDIGLRRFRYR